jgi:hypothetical protein
MPLRVSSRTPAHHPETVQLDLVQPTLAAGRSFGGRWKARLNETTAAGTQQHAIRIDGYDRTVLVLF